MTTVHDDEPRSLVAQERVVVTPHAGLFVFLLATIGLAVTVTLVAIGADLPAEPQAAEQAVQDADGLASSLYGAMDVRGARLATALLAGIAVVATGAATRQLFHSDGIGLLAAFLLAADPGFLALGQMALPLVPAAAFALGALALALAGSGTARWAAGVLLAVGTLLQPGLALWALPLAALALLRGNIYAAPKHLGIALLQLLLLPALAFIATVAIGPAAAECLMTDPFGALVLAHAVDLGAGRVAFHDPAVWLAGWAALLLLGGAALWRAGRQFRMARLPGRLQFRLIEPLGVSSGRILWLLLFAATAPVPLLWLPLVAAALAAGVGELAGDSPGFGLTVAGGLAVFAILYLVRLWGVVDGSASPQEAQELLGILPWASITTC